MIGDCFGLDWGALVAIYMGLALFGIGYNILTARAEEKGYIRGYTSLFVAAGVGITVAALGIINWLFALITLGAFVASGLPMILGSIWRHMKERERQIEQLRREAHGDEAKALADKR